MAKRYQSGFYEIARQAALAPQESLLEVQKQKGKLFIGIPRETSYQENRVALNPQGVRMLTAQGHTVMVEANAGLEANYTNQDYSDAGAQISYEKKEVFKSDLLLKVAFPTYEEIEMMNHQQTLISALHVPLLREKDLRLLMKKQITALAFEMLRDESLGFPIIQSMSEIAGNSSILIGAEYLSNVNNGKGIMLGGASGVAPCQIVILGAGTVGQYASRAAIGLGADIKLFDNSLYKLRRLQSFLARPVYTSVLNSEVLEHALADADLAIGALRNMGGRPSFLVSENMVMNMKPGAVIVDVAIDQGGSFETSTVTSHAKPTYVKHDVVHYCVPNIPSRVARTASYMLSNILSPIVTDIGDSGGIKNYLWEKEGIRYGAYIYKGNLTNRYLGERFNIPYKEIDLLIAAHI